MGTTTALTVEDFLALPPPPDGQHYELSDGELVSVGYTNLIHEYVKSTIHELLIAWNLPTRNGRVFGESMFILYEGTLRQPDIAYVSKERLPSLPHELLDFAPDLAVEVISTSETAAEMEKKVQQYLRAGVAEVWQVYPESRVVLVRTKAGVRELHEEDILESPVLPGFRVGISELFK